LKFKDAIAANARTVAKLSDADLKQLIPVLEAARVNTARGLANWLKRVDGEDKYTAATHRQLLSSIDSAIVAMKREMFPAIHLDLQREGRDAGLTALKAMRKAAEAGSKKFEDSATPLKFDAAKIVMSSSRALMSKYTGSATRYAGRRGDEIKKQLAVGLVRGESVDSVVARLMGKPQLLSKRMSDSDKAEAVADNQFFKNKSDAERLVRTENIHAANAVQMDALTEDNENADADESSGGEGGWQKRWDATFDKRTCEYCEDLDGEIRDADEEFEEGVMHPPLHPYCRCTITPWREGWEL
jgi:SPP1 gp7 family putative phage head morphogenesis protein